VFGTVQRNLSAGESFSIDSNGDLEIGRATGWDRYGLRAIDFAESDGGIDENGYCVWVTVAVGVTRQVRANGLGTA
jgi:hypothetical protein